MSRPLRVEFEGAVYHVTARGNSGLHVYEDDLDRNRFLDFLAQELKQQLWLCHAYCLMGTHWHLLLETPEPNLSCGMAREWHLRKPTNEDQVATRSRATQTIALAISIGLCFLAAAIGGIATASSVTGWYAEISKPTWTPPDWVFGPVWTVLYLSMAVAAWLVWKNSGFEKAKIALGWFGFHLILNTLWSLIFFGLRQPGWAFAEIVFLWLSILVSMALFNRHSRWAAVMLVPYLFWVSFAAALNYAIWSLNRIA